MLIIMPELVISGIFFALNWGQSVTDDAKASKNIRQWPRYVQSMSKTQFQCRMASSCRPVIRAPESVVIEDCSQILPE
jgi:hypothetical protein